MKRIPLLMTTIIMVLMLAGCHEHNFSEATCTEPETCVECGETQGEAYGHRFSEATCTEPATCRRCGETQGTALGHTWEAATCTVAKTCKRCGKTEGVPLPHEYKEADCVTPKTCKNCGTTAGISLGHDYEKGNCEKPQKCRRCGDTIPAPGHDYKEATCTEPQVCGVCGETKGEALGHKMEGAVCSRCGYSLGSLAYLKTFCGRHATCETDKEACVVKTNTAHNPYDVEYDYGDDYKELIALCDWSLVFDADYYIKQFPMLAYLYHNDKDLLLEHFQTVGIHEGRQGCASFNVWAYYYNCDVKIYKTFEQAYEGYYLYYMLNYDQEKNVDTVNPPEGKEKKKQCKMVKTAIQSVELKYINQYRNEVSAEDVEYNSELQAFANYRAYINVMENWDAHDWTINLGNKVWDYFKIFTKTDDNKMAENNVTMGRNNYNSLSFPLFYDSYYHSKSHYDAMVSEKYHYVGVSNVYFGDNNRLNTYQKNNKIQGAQFDVYLKYIE